MPNAGVCLIAEERDVLDGIRTLRKAGEHHEGTVGGTGPNQKSNAGARKVHITCCPPRTRIGAPDPVAVRHDLFTVFAAIRIRFSGSSLDGVAPRTRCYIRTILATERLIASAFGILL